MSSNLSCQPIFHDAIGVPPKWIEIDSIAGSCRIPSGEGTYTLGGLVEDRGINVGLKLRIGSVGASSASSSSAASAICWNGTLTEVSGTGSRDTNGMSL